VITVNDLIRHKVRDTTEPCASCGTITGNVLLPSGIGLCWMCAFDRAVQFLKANRRASVL
jgi:hypothetical protein